MNRLLTTVFLIAALAPSVRADAPPFSQSVSPDDFKSAGLDHLSPAEISQLDALVTAYKNGAVASERHALAKAVEAKQVAEAEATAAKAEVVEIKKTSFGFFSKAKILLMPGTKVEYAVIKSTIPGPFQGWEGRATFVLANGQSWQMVTPSSYYTRQINDIEVEITESKLGGYWLRFPSLDAQVRVRLLGDR